MFWANKPYTPFQRLSRLIKALLATNSVLAKKAIPFSFNMVPACCFGICAASNNTLSIKKGPECFRAFVF